MVPKYLRGLLILNQRPSFKPFQWSRLSLSLGLLEGLVSVSSKGDIHVNCLFLHKGERIGRSFLAGASLFGIGSLCYYGLGLSGEAGAVDKARCVHYSNVYQLTIGGY